MRTKKTEELKKRAVPYLLYTALFLLCAGFVVALCVTNGRSPIYHSDAFRQHLRALRFFGEWVRGGMQSTWSSGFGYGADVLTTLHYYCILDPLALSAVVVPARYTYLLFEVLIVVRWYLSGIAFLLFVGEVRPCSLLSRVAGALTYVFCGYALYLGILHPFFLNACIYLPLVLFGLERIFHGKSPAVFVPAVLVSVISNFYFFYMIVLVTVVYFFWRAFFFYRERLSVCFILRVFLSALTGVLMGCFILLPVLASFAENPRSGVQYALSLFYPAAYYRELLANLFTYINHPLYDTNLGYAILFVPAVLYLLIRGRHRNAWRVLTVVIALFLVFPFGGFVMNGFSYVINRWVFAVALFAGCAVSVCMEEWELLHGKGHVIPALLTGLTVCSVLFNTYRLYAPAAGNFVSEMTIRFTPETYEAAQAANEASALQNYVTETGEEDSFFRYSGRNLTWNASLNGELSSTQFCFSLANGVVSDYFKDLGVNEEQSFAYFGLDDREILLSVAGVRYYTLAYDNYYEERFVPSSYVRSAVTDGLRTDGEMTASPWQYVIYENPDVMPFAYTFDSVITKVQWEKMSPTMREEAMTQAVLLEDDEASSQYPVAEITYTQERMDPAIATTGGITYEDGRITVTETSAYLGLTFAGLPAAETSLVFDNLYYEGEAEIADISVSAMQGEEEYIQKYLSYKTPKSQYYSNWHNFVVNLCYEAEAKTELRVRFDAAGTYTFDDLYVVCRPVMNVASTGSATALTAVLEHTAVPEHVEGPATAFPNPSKGAATLEATTSSDTILLLNIPYTRGWHATVDGTSTDILKANRMFSALPLTAGTHEITLSYRTPYLSTGILLSIAGLVIFLYCRKKRVLCPYLPTGK